MGTFDCTMNSHFAAVFFLLKMSGKFYRRIGIAKMKLDKSTIWMTLKIET